MKKLLAIILVLSMVFALVSCGAKDVVNDDVVVEDEIVNEEVKDEVTE